MSLEKPWNDVADQLRPVEPDTDGAIVDEEAAVGRAELAPEPSAAAVIEADPADVADQNRLVRLDDDPADDSW